MVARHESWMIKSYEQTLSAIAAAPAIDDRDWSGCQRYFPRILNSQKLYINVGIIDLTGRVRCAGTGLDSFASENLADREYFQRALETSGFVLSDYLDGRLSKKPTMVIAKAIKGPEKRSEDRRVGKECIRTSK